MRSLRMICVAALTGAFVLALVAPAEAARKVPRGFFGVMADGPILLRDASLARELDRMVATGVESIRVPFHWRDAQPFERMEDVPESQRDRYELVDGVPTSFIFTDKVAAEAAKRHLHVLPVVVRAPSWALLNKSTDASRPRNYDDYTRYLGALVRRYGQNGTFWAAHPELPKRPIRDWQIWNEPNLIHFWYQQPFAPEYVKLLRQSRDTIKSIDPGARAVLGGLVYQSWQSLEEVYKAGGRTAFDYAAIHPFTGKLSNVRLLVSRSRQVMNRYGDARKPLLLTEMSWTSGLGKSGVSGLGWQQTPRGQAERLTEAYDSFAKVRRKWNIPRIYWYTWASPDRGRGNSFNWAGLRRAAADGTTVAKPAFGAFRRVVRKFTGCTPTRVADRCR
jgi:hypothetical protein